MSDSPRWHLDGLPGTTGIVEVMLYADHVADKAAAVAEAEQRVREQTIVSYDMKRAEQAERNGYAAALDAARDAVAAELDVYRADCINDGKGVSLPVIDTFRHVLTVIDALKGEQA